MKAGSNRKDVKSIVEVLRLTLKGQNEKLKTISDRELILHIRNETARQNQNNISRTNAYLEFYHRNPEVHWALLAHCVSRNGGYGMTDVKGELFLHMASNLDSTRFFSYLERANWLIFHDAYAQMLLYEEGKRLNRNMCHLLPALGVSRFMQPIWNHFLLTQDSSLLTRALIINEQNYIEERVVKNNVYQSTVETSTLFKMESFLNLNQVLMPYYYNKEVRLAGTTTRHFVSVNDRIRTGLKLYHGLFQDQKRHLAIIRFLDNIPHSGSRADYWPDVFTRDAPSSFHNLYQPRFTAKHSASSKIYSPILEAVWPIVDHIPPETGDWFQDLGHVIYLFDEPTNQAIDISDKYIQSIKTAETLITAKEKAQKFLQR